MSDKTETMVRYFSPKSGTITIVPEIVYSQDKQWALDIHNCTPISLLELQFSSTHYTEAYVHVSSATEILACLFKQVPSISQVTLIVNSHASLEMIIDHVAALVVCGVDDVIMFSRHGVKIQTCHLQDEVFEFLEKVCVTEGLLRKEQS